MEAKKIWLDAADYNIISSSAGFHIIHLSWQLRLCQKYQDIICFPPIDMPGNGIRARIKGRGERWMALEVFA